MADNATTIAQYLANMGLNRSAIAGVMGNLRIESSDNPGAYNSNEGAIGIAQWEGGRRTTLQQLARSMGRSETDLGVQLEMLRREIEGMGLVNTLNGAGNAGNAAAIFDAQFERSAGTSRGARISAANDWFTNGKYTGGEPANDSRNSLADSKGGGPLGGTAAAATTRLKPEDYEQALGSLGGLLESVPELKSKLDQAVAGEWSEAKFQQEVQQTSWYRSHNQATRELLALQTADPAEYKTKLSNESSHVSAIAHQLGVTLNPSQINGIVMEMLSTGGDDQALQHKIASLYNTGANPAGQAAQYYQQLRQVYDQYGQSTNFAQTQHRVQSILAGDTTIDTYKQDAINKARIMYPGLTQQFDQGLTVADAAQPYIQSMSQTLEIDPNSINLQDPTIKRALQGQAQSVNAKGQAQDYLTTPMWQFEQTLKNDPRWQYTQNAKDSMSQALVKIGQDFGFAGSL